MICGHDLGDGYVCAQAAGHLDDGVPHLRYGEGIEYWVERAKAARSTPTPPADES